MKLYNCESVRRVATTTAKRQRYKYYPNEREREGEGGKNERPWLLVYEHEMGWMKPGGQRDSGKHTKHIFQDAGERKIKIIEANTLSLATRKRLDQLY